MADENNAEDLDDSPVNKRPEWEIVGEDEAEYHFSLQHDYTTEVRVYEELSEFQGNYIPRFLSTVLLDMPSAPANLPPHYFQIPGILIEKLDGFNLTDLVEEMPNADLSLLQRIIQRAVDIAIKMNLKGVMSHDCCPRNAIVCYTGDVGGQETPRICLVDFARASFRSDYTDDCERSDGEDYNMTNCECWDCKVLHKENPVEIGQIMNGKAVRMAKQKLQIKYSGEWGRYNRIYVEKLELET